MATSAVPPFYYPIVDPDSASKNDFRITVPWNDWFLRLAADSGLGLSALYSSVAALTARVAALESQVASLNAALITMTTQYKLEVDTIDASTLYRGEALPGTATSAASWRISLVTITGDDMNIRWAAGTASFNQIWDNRLSLSYS